MDLQQDIDKANEEAEWDALFEEIEVQSNSEAFAKEQQQDEVAVLADTVVQGDASPSVTPAQEEGNEWDDLLADINQTSQFDEEPEELPSMYKRIAYGFASTESDVENLTQLIEAKWGATGRLGWDMNNGCQKKIGIFI